MGATVVDHDRDGGQDLVRSLWGCAEYRLKRRFVRRPGSVLTVPTGQRRPNRSLGDGGGDGNLDIHALILNTVARTDPHGVGLRNNALLFAAVPVLRATCIGDDVTTRDGNCNGRGEFLVVTGVETKLPTQRLELRFQ